MEALLERFVETRATAEVTCYCPICTAPMDPIPGQGLGTFRNEPATDGHGRQWSKEDGAYYQCRGLHGHVWFWSERAQDFVRCA